jgi:hypothetical protein
MLLAGTEWHVAVDLAGVGVDSVESGKDESVSSMLLGSLFHRRLLLGEVGYVVAGGCVKCGRPGRSLSGGEWYCGLHNKGLASESADSVDSADSGVGGGSVVLSPEDGSRIEGMVSAVSGVGVTNRLLSECPHRELSFFAAELFLAGDRSWWLKQKCRVDAMGFRGDRVLLLDVKTSSDVSRSGIERSMVRYRYYLQAEYYRWMVENWVSRGWFGRRKFSGVDFVFVFVESRSPYGVSIWEWSPADAEESSIRRELESLKGRYAGLEYQYAGLGLLAGEAGDSADSADSVDSADSAGVDRVRIRNGLCGYVRGGLPAWYRG